MKVLIAVDGTDHSLAAVDRVAREARVDPGMTLCLMNVQRPLSAHVGQFLPQRDLVGFRRSRAAQALAPARRLLDAAGVHYRVIETSGDPAARIAQTANAGGFDRVVLATTRKNALSRLLSGSVTQRVIDRARVPVVVVPAGDGGLLARYGVPVGIGLGLALYFLAAE